ncbi:MAG TPA: hypothetical protein VLJ59_02760 [Mycobacteriales bacterium]|nr:hypothetical protein [Mycobacteriales bacterium]
MSSTILTVIVLVVMWAVVLVPIMVRRVDELDEVAAVPAGPEPARSTGRVLLRRARVVAGKPGSAVSATLVADGRVAMLTRRRRAVGVLVALVVVSGTAAALGSPVLWAAHVACDVVLVGCLVWLRAEVRRAAVARTAVPVAPSRPWVVVAPVVVSAPARAPASAPILVQVIGLDDDDPSFAEIDERLPRAVNG